MNSNMINPANYYNPFAKYNYVSKTRGAYVPPSASATWNAGDTSVKSASIWSDNYDAETEVSQSLFDSKETSNGILGFLNGLLGDEN